MQHVLVTCADQTLAQACKSELETLGCSLHWVESSEAALQYIHNHRVDLVLVHSINADPECLRMLEVLRSFSPEVPIILTADRLDYWSNFRSWYADCCLVPTPGPQVIKERISDLLHLSVSSSRKLHGNGFTVDWG